MLSRFHLSGAYGIPHLAFHDNSAKTLEEVADHYQRFLQIVGRPVVLTEQDKQDIVA